MRYLSGGALERFANALTATHEVFAPQRRGDGLVLERVGEVGSGEVPWNACRLPEPLKSIWFQPGKVVARWPPGAGREEARPRAVFGAKACDLKAVACLDRVLRDHEFKEPAWCAARERTLLIAGDCDDCAPSCFCTMVGDRPYPTSLFDLCLSPSGDGFLVETGSPRGEQLVAAHEELFAAAPPEAIAGRDRARREMTERVRDQNARFPVRDPFEKSVAKHERTRIWGELAATCVECHACNMVCPTCHCFLLHDVPAGAVSLRLSLWDSCFSAGHARMAGGLTPRLQLTERFRNHYQHKFVTFPRNWGITACSGCGRCVDACMGRIDKRECLHLLETRWIPSEIARELA
ncbi:MAG TPA: 4Fe-4S dicluster domain-containing protein [Thermoanaerobaculia bacterium]|nr:4Fe-4S dicluster domain-containing protein [Thermoanaerobaculia bacterium]